MNHVFLKRELGASEDKIDQFAVDPADIPDGVMARFDARRLEPWKESALRAIAFAEARSVKILGISGVREDAGNSNITAAIARTCSDYGQRTLLIDANKANLGDNSEVPNMKLLNMTSSATPVSRQLHFLNLSRTEFTLPQNPDYFRSVFQIALEYYHMIIVDLPGLVTGLGQPAPANLAIGAACNAVFLVCETGRTTRNDVQQCIASSKISGIQIEGILLNDGKLPMNRILSKF